MKTTTRAAALILAALISSSAIEAAEETKSAAPAGSASTAGAVTLAEVRAGALARSNALRKALLGVDAAELTRKTRIYDVLPSPSLGAKAGASYGSGSNLDDSLSTSLSLSVAQTVFDGGKTAAMAAIDRLDSEAARAAARSAYFAAVLEAEQAFYAALKAQAAGEAARSDLEAARLHLELAAAKLEAGVIAKPAYLEAESEEAAKETAYDQAAAAAKTAARKLASIAGISPNAPLSDEDADASEKLAARMAGLSDADAERFAAELVSAALKGNPDLAQATLATAKAEGEVDYAKKGALPTVSASWSHDASYGASSGLELSGGSLSVTASLSLDLWATKAAVDAKDIAARQAALDQAETYSSNELDIRSAVYSAVSDARAIASSRKALEYAEGHYASQLEAFKLSTLSSSDLSDAEVLVGSARSSLISARYSFLSELASLRSLAGFDEAGLLEAALP